MTYFLQAGDSFFPAPSKEALLEGLPPAVYTLEESMSGWYFKRGEAFQKLPKLYGSIEGWRDRVLASFEARSSNTGVLLSGEKGSGKSLLARLISDAGAQRGMATVLVNKPIEGSVLGQMLGQLSSPAVIFMDEFEKVFGKSEAQEEILGLLDGTNQSRHLFVLTVNDTNRMDKHLKNRPGRLYYHIEFQGLEEAFVEDYCREHLQREEWINDVKRVASLFDAFNFDMLQALVEEVNRFDEAPLQAVRLLNITPATLEEAYTVEAFSPSGKKLPLYQNDFWGSPLQLQRYYVSFEIEEENDVMAEWERELLGASERMMISQADLFECKVEEGIYEFRKEGMRVIFKRAPRTKGVHWTAAF